eukprot:854554_1
MGNTVYSSLGGNYSGDPSNLRDSVSKGALDLIGRAFDGLDPHMVLDSHAHLIGVGRGGANSGCYIHQKFESWNPYYFIKKGVLCSAAGVSPGDPEMDTNYVDRLVELVRHCVPPNCPPTEAPIPQNFPTLRNIAENKDRHPSDEAVDIDSNPSPPADTPDPKGGGPQNSRCVLLAFDQTYTEDGVAHPELTGMHIPNDYAWRVARAYPNLFLAACSVHPYRADACDELAKWARRGVRMVKWLPNTMGIDPDNPKCKPFYEKMKELDMVLLSHTGQEHAVDAGFQDQTFGNPLKLRSPLDCGVRVIAAHCATDGRGRKYDNGDDDQNNCEVDNVDLLLELMDEERYSDLLFADISAILAFRRVRHIAKLLQRTDLHHRFLYGSDYPVPCANVVVHLGILKRHGLLTKSDCSFLSEIYAFNPLLFNFCAVRSLRLRVSGDSGRSFAFADCVFQQHALLRALDEQQQWREEDEEVGAEIARN